MNRQRLMLLSKSLITLMAATALAAPPSLASPPQAEPTARIDPQAAQVLGQMSNAYRSLHSYSVMLDVAENRNGGTPVPFSHAQIAYQRPDRARVTITIRTAHPTQAVADGVVTTVTGIVNGQVRYCQKPSVRGNDIAYVLVQEIGSHTPFPVHVLDGTDLLPSLRERNMESLSLGPPRVVDGVPVVTVVAHIPHAAPEKQDWLFLIGRDDHLLRRAEDAWTQADGTSSVIYAFSGMQVNPPLPDSLFAYTPPPGAQRVDSQAALFADPRRGRDLKVGDIAPPIRCSDLDGQPLSLAQFRGRVVLLDVWATWCGPCRAAMPTLARLDREYGARGLTVLSVSEDTPADLEKVRAVARQLGVTWRQAREGDPDDYVQGDVYEAYAAEGLPFTVVIGRDGRVAAVDPDVEVLERAVTAALTGKRFSAVRVR